MHTWKWITGVSPHTGKPKLATSRIVKPGQNEVWLEDIFTGERLGILAVGNGGRWVYEVDHTYAVMPARGVKGIRKVADIQITVITRYDVRGITDVQVATEGFASKFDFMQVWNKMHMGSSAWYLEYTITNVYPDAVKVAEALLT